MASGIRMRSGSPVSAAASRPVRALDPDVSNPPPPSPKPSTSRLLVPRPSPIG